MKLRELLNESSLFQKVLGELVETITGLTGKQWGAGGGLDGCSREREKFSLKNPGRLRAFKMKGSGDHEEEIIRKMGKRTGLKIAVSLKSIPTKYSIDGIEFGLTTCGKRPDVLLSSSGKKVDTKLLDDEEFYEKLY